MRCVQEVMQPCTGNRRGIYEVAQTYGEDKGEPDSSPWAWQAGGQYMAWLAVQAVGERPQMHCSCAVFSCLAPWGNPALTLRHAASEHCLHDARGT